MSKAASVHIGLAQSDQSFQRSIRDIAFRGANLDCTAYQQVAVDVTHVKGGQVLFCGLLGDLRIQVDWGALVDGFVRL